MPLYDVTKVGKLAIIGAGGFAMEVRAAIKEPEQRQGAKFFVTEGFEETFVDVATVEKLEEFDDIVIAIGNSKARKAVATKFYPEITRKNAFPIFIQDGDADIEQYNRNHIVMDDGTVICRGSILTWNVKIGKFTIVNIGSMIGHDVVIGDFVTISPSCNIMGNVTIEDEVELGTAVTCIPGVTVGKGSIIGAGAVVTRDIPPNSLAVGIPAKVIKQL